MKHTRKQDAIKGEINRKIKIKRGKMLPAVGNGDNASAVLSNVLEDGLREVEVLEGRVAPAAGIVG